MMVVRLGGVSRIDLASVRLDIVDANGKVLQSNIKTDRLDSDDIRNATILPPTDAFKVRLTGNLYVLILLSKVPKISMLS